MAWFLRCDGEAWTGLPGWFEAAVGCRRVMVGDDHHQVRLGAADTTPEEVAEALKPVTEAWSQRQASLK